MAGITGIIKPWMMSMNWTYGLKHDQSVGSKSQAPDIITCNCSFNEKNRYPLPISLKI